MLHGYVVFRGLQGVPDRGAEAQNRAVGPHWLIWFALGSFLVLGVFRWVEGGTSHPARLISQNLGCNSRVGARGAGCTGDILGIGHALLGTQCAK